jgi:hypothetical protein
VLARIDYIFLLHSMSSSSSLIWEIILIETKAFWVLFYILLRCYLFILCFHVVACRLSSGPQTCKEELYHLSHTPSSLFPIYYSPSKTSLIQVSVEPAQYCQVRLNYIFSIWLIIILEVREFLCYCCLGMGIPASTRELHFCSPPDFSCVCG